VRFACIAFALCAALPAAAATRTYRWTFAHKPSVAEVAAVSDDLRKLLEASGAAAEIPLALRQSLMAWVVLGFDPGSRERGQAFLWPGGEAGWLVRTDEDRYDALVAASLLAIRDHFLPEQLTISSTAKWPEWSEGAALYRTALGREPRDPGLGVRTSALTWALMGFGVIAALFAIRWLRNRTSAIRR
jgi:hypothetical protein